MNNLERRAEVARTGKIPFGSEVHVNHFHNLRYADLVAAYHRTEDEIKAGSCHRVWGLKRLAKLQRLIDSKVRKFEKKHTKLKQ